MKIVIGVGPGVGAAASMGAERFWSVVDTCESIGWDSLWFSERVGGDIPDPLAAMAAAIGRTKRLKFGTSVLVLPGRNPVLLAKELATMDVLSDGRIVPVFGLGSPVPSEHEIFGVDPSARGRMTDEAAVLIKRLWTEEKVTFEGEFYSVHDLTLLPKPVQQPHPDVWFGGHSKAACRRVGRVGTGWLPSFIAPSEYKTRVDVIRAEADAHGRQIEDDHYGALIAYIPPGAEEMTDTILQLVAARRKDVDPRDVIATDGTDELRARIEEFIVHGASKFALIPAVPPQDWPDELVRLYDDVAVPLSG